LTFRLKFCVGVGRLLLELELELLKLLEQEELQLLEEDELQLDELQLEDILIILPFDDARIFYHINKRGS
jgi:hypothetical protein